MKMMHTMDDILENDTFDDLDDIFENDTFDDLGDDNDIDDEINLRNVKEKDNLLNKRKVFYVRGLMSDDNSEIYQIEEYITPSLNENREKIDLREKNVCDNCSQPNITQ